jgi:hypothetical protein
MTRLQELRNPTLVAKGATRIEHSGHQRNMPEVARPIVGDNSINSRFAMAGGPIPSDQFYSRGWPVVVAAVFAGRVARLVPKRATPMGCQRFGSCVEVAGWDGAWFSRSSDFSLTQDLRPGLICAAPPGLGRSLGQFLRALHTSCRFLPLVGMTVGWVWDSFIVL